MDEKTKRYSKIGWGLTAIVLIVILFFLPEIIEVEFGPGLIFIEFISAFGILVLSWHILLRHE